MVADILSDIAWFNWVMGKLDAALDAVEQALPIREKSNGPENAKIADLLHRKGTCLWDVGRFAEGEDFLRRAALMRERLHGPEADPTLRSLTNLAALLQEEGKLAEADQLYTHLMEIWKRQGARIGGYPRTILEISTLHLDEPHLRNLCLFMRWRNRRTGGAIPSPSSALHYSIRQPTGRLRRK